jgi:hypothetical protein
VHPPQEPQGFPAYTVPPNESGSPPLPAGQEAPSSLIYAIRNLNEAPTHDTDRIPFNL